ncbi:MBOAT family protein [Alphaproteobacteria bacterium]|nr:MBOAT family protein [Alphaproteobacteria bacterium]
MIFSSYLFLLVFVPVLLVVLTALQSGSSLSRCYVLVLASLGFYAWYDWRYLALIVASAIINFQIARAIECQNVKKGIGRKALLIIGVVFNLTLLSYFKYVDFLLVSINSLLSTEFQLFNVLMPIGISFFTFQQIAYLIDVHGGTRAEPSFPMYLLFISFFPQLIAGPIVHHRGFMLQVREGVAGLYKAPMIAAGVTIFTLGLAKKVIFADQIAKWSTPVFDAASGGAKLPLLESWTGAIAYTFQIYFDFSGYSDMAIGLGLIFGLRLPINFVSPYKAVSIIDFWRRWHITLSSFLRDYLYIPLGGNKNGRARQYLNLMIVMILGGLWHGAGWSFIIWGGLHGIALLVNHAWCRLTRLSMPSPCSVFITFVFVIFAWVPFRADDLASALEIWRGMAGMNGVAMPETYADRLGLLLPVAVYLNFQFVNTELFHGLTQIWVFAALLAVVWFLPSSVKFIGYTFEGGPCTDRPILLGWRPLPLWALGISATFIIALYYMNSAGEFLYYAF